MERSGVIVEQCDCRSTSNFPATSFTSAAHLTGSPRNEFQSSHGCKMLGPKNIRILLDIKIALGS